MLGLFIELIPWANFNEGNYLELLQKWVKIVPEWGLLPVPVLIGELQLWRDGNRQLCKVNDA